MISESYKKNIIDLLNGQLIKSDDFVLNESDEQGYNIIIIYRYDPEIMLSINIDYRGEPVAVTYSPGNILSLEKKFIKAEINVESLIKQWIINIDLKMNALPIIRKINEQENNLNSIKDMMKEYIDDTNFNSTEIEDLTSKLNTLEVRFEEKIKSDVEINNEREKLIAEMKMDISRLKAEANILTKKNWLLSFYTKLHLLTQKHPKLTALIGGIAYDSLPESIRDNIPESSVKMLMNAESNETIDEINK